ncbi:uncharacterized protein LOC133886139 isoform X2 [Phragmites australis]|uniref:uncharacterized protein LOC133886139 isoform X2 n=1 Tax=Phragmites australis TaxID=29695 RepID=UPI002D771BD2|nr:uncharacterized protein LOC133886139 isoform X2 [Phragmites australis]
MGYLQKREQTSGARAPSRLTMELTRTGMGSRHGQDGFISVDVPAEGSHESNYNLKLDDALSAFFSYGVPMVNLFLVLSFFGKMQYHKQTIVSIWSIFYLVSLVLSFFIHVAGMQTSWWIQQVEWQCKIAYWSTVLRMLAAAFLLLFLDTVHAVVVVPLLLLVLALVSYFWWQTFYSTYRPGMNWGNYMAELKLRFDLSAQVVSMAFAGLSGTVLGYVKGSSNLTYGNIAVAPECFLFYSVVLGLLVVILSTVPTRILFIKNRRRMAKVYLPILAYAALLFLVVASIVAAEKILRDYVFFVFIAILVVAVLFFWWENHYAANRIVPERPAHEVHPTTNTLREQDAKLSQYLLVYFTALFAALMAIHSMYSIKSGRTVSLSRWLKGFVLSAMCSILIYAVRIVVYAEMRDMESWAFGRKAWTYATYATMFITFVSAVLVMYLRPAEVTNIF